MFDDVDSVVKLVYKQSFSSFVSLVNSKLQTTPRGSFSTLPTTAITPGFLSAILNQTRVGHVTFSALNRFPSTYVGTRYIGTHLGTYISYKPLSTLNHDPRLWNMMN